MTNFILWNDFCRLTDDWGCELGSNLLKSEEALVQIFLSKHSLSNQTKLAYSMLGSMSFQIQAQALD